MRFGKTHNEREELAQADAERYSDYKWFAWYPVELQSGRIAFLEHVNRSDYKFDDYHEKLMRRWKPRYREIFK